MVRYQGGDEEAFREIYMRTSGAIERYLKRWSDSSRAADLTQDVYLQIHRARRTYRPELPLRPWMFAIARHVALQYIRTRGRRIAELQDDSALIAAAVGSPEAAVVARHDLTSALSELSPELRESLWLSEVEGFTSVEVARITGASEGAVRVRVHRARQKLRAVLNQSGGDA